MKKNLCAFAFACLAFTFVFVAFFSGSNTFVSVEQKAVRGLREHKDRAGIRASCGWEQPSSLLEEFLCEISKFFNHLLACRNSVRRLI